MYYKFTKEVIDIMERRREHTRIFEDDNTLLYEGMYLDYKNKKIEVEDIDGTRTTVMGSYKNWDIRWLEPYNNELEKADDL